MKKVFITGANKSMGFETARQLAKKGHYIYLGSRDKKKVKKTAGKKPNGLGGIPEDNLRQMRSLENDPLLVD